MEDGVVVVYGYAADDGFAVSAAADEGCEGGCAYVDDGAGLDAGCDTTGLVWGVGCGSASSADWLCFLLVKTVVSRWKSVLNEGTSNAGRSPQLFQSMAPSP